MNNKTFLMWLIAPLVLVSIVMLFTSNYPNLAAILAFGGLTVMLIIEAWYKDSGGQL